jgi:hypothetical protein
MSWGAHQFEIYAVQAHLPRRMRGRVSFFGVWLGDFTPDFLSKFWVYGVTIGGTRYGAGLPHQWHRGWPGMGVTHTLFFGLLVSGGLWLWRRKRALTVGYALGFAAHALTDVNDSVGTMLLFPFSTLNWTTETWSYAATVSRASTSTPPPLQQPGPGHGPAVAGRGAPVVAGADPGLLANPDRAAQPPRLGPARAAHARARAAGPLPRHVLLRRLPGGVVRGRSSTASVASATRWTCRGRARGGSTRGRSPTCHRRSSYRWSGCCSRSSTARPAACGNRWAPPRRRPVAGSGNACVWRACRRRRSRSARWPWRPPHSAPRFADCWPHSGSLALPIRRLAGPGPRRSSGSSTSTPPPSSVGPPRSWVSHERAQGSRI